MKPILFNTAMVQAIQRGDKTVTRRLVKPQPEERLTAGDNALEILAAASAPYHPGDILYVRETWCFIPCSECESNCTRWNLGIENPGCYIYKADEKQDPYERWRPSIHMPKEATRIFLRVTDVRVERLQDSFTAQGATIIALQDEGIDIGDHCRQCIEHYGYPCCNDLDPDLGFDEDTGEDEGGGSECGMLDRVRYKYSLLWDSTINTAYHSIYGWDANPWVWVIEFEQISKEEAMDDA